MVKPSLGGRECQSQQSLWDDAGPQVFSKDSIFLLLLFTRDSRVRNEDISGFWHGPLSHRDDGLWENCPSQVSYASLSVNVKVCDCIWGSIATCPLHMDGIRPVCG